MAKRKDDDEFREPWMRVVRGECSGRALAKELGVSRNTLDAIVARNGWPKSIAGTAPVDLPQLPSTENPRGQKGVENAIRALRVNLAYLARNRTESHEQVLRIIMKARCHLESWMDEHTAEGRLFGPSTIKAIGHALAWLERIEAERQRMITYHGAARVKFALIESCVTKRPPAPGEAPPDELPLREDGQPDAPPEGGFAGDPPDGG